MELYALYEIGVARVEVGYFTFYSYGLRKFGFKNYKKGFVNFTSLTPER